ncbi:unnamed protein product [Heterobilharzia americana]|nr:unnamed protein product [Heterobilharzia americana]
MNKRKRQFIHDIVEFYGMESFTYGLESNRYVMVIARRGYCKLPGGVIDHRGSLLNILKQEFPNNINFLNEKHNLDENSKIDCHLLPISNISTVSYAQILRGQRLE